QLSAGKAIREACKHLNRLVSNVLTITRLESGHFKLALVLYDIKQLVDEAIADTKAVLANHDVIVDIAQNLPAILMDHALMEQVLVNLLMNAGIHTPSGVRI